MPQPEKYAIADLHLNHENSIQLCSRPFINKEEMDAVILEGINKTVQPRDTLYLLGDNFFSNEKETGRNYLETAKFYRKQIKCRNVHLVRGNHDKKSADYLFSSSQDFLKIKDNHQKYIMCHRPFLCWDSSHSGSYHIHGHTHAGINWYVERFLKECRLLDVGVDNIYLLKGEFRPLHFSEIDEILSKRLGFCPDIKDTHHLLSV